MTAARLANHIDQRARLGGGESVEKQGMMVNLPLTTLRGKTE